ncbi:phage virion morphogenesis protein [Larsenimonas suaedae]|uniref:Phage virion morphogenesis protein n=1 Tax=Larsenimonas suaedae TaxID=1851019 RepID=A0ABU1GYK6_9GAMM|nr:phage virion morphogenesis protein [Larsenimonas suaedae]MCM2973502.1 phage virion morphogenesis protein [Larsenimonas suaedae]MDR5897128.1 phage virion morphogenesis protein [Larsenimonas suaedae]
MPDDLQRLEDWAAPLLAKLDAKERRRLARSVATDLRRAQRERIKAQKNPDGTSYAPRKSRDQQGTIRRRAMFGKLRTAKYLKIRTSPHGAEIGFFGRVASIAKTHQFGLRDRVSRTGPRVQYEQRELLGFTEHDHTLLRDTLLDHLNDGL